MKHNKYKNKTNVASSEHLLVPVRFTFTNPTVATVCVAGCFNHWRPESKALQSSGVGHWSGETALAPGTYEYCLVVDGHWMPDPLVSETVSNPFGGRNSVLKVARSMQADHLAAAEHLPLENKNTQQMQTL